MKGVVRSTGTFYPGIQRYKFLNDKSFRAALVFSALSGLLAAPVFICFEKGIWKSLYYHGALVLTMLSYAIFALLGGLPRRAVAWYWSFCALYMLSVPFLQNDLSAIFFVPLLGAVVCGAVVLRLAPGLLVKSGYKDRSPALAEFLFVLLGSSIFAYFVFMVLARSLHLKAIPWTAGSFTATLLSSAIEYFVYAGIVYGIFTKRMAETGQEPMLPVICNVFFMSLWWAPSAFTQHVSTTFFNFIGNVGAALTTNLPLVIIFYFCRSTRAVFICLLVYSVLTKIYLR